MSIQRWHHINADTLAGEPLRLSFTPPPAPGRFIVVEGLDGCGKSTFVEALCAFLTNHGQAVMKTKFPTQELRDHAAFQYFTREGREDLVDFVGLQASVMGDRINHANMVVRKACEAGTWVIADRYFLSWAGHQLIRGGRLDGWFGALARELPAPHHGFHLHAPTDIALDRIRQRVAEQDHQIDPRYYTALATACAAVAKQNDFVFVNTHDVRETAYTTLFEDTVLASSHQVAGAP